MADYDPHINIDPLLESRDGYYNIKEVEIEHSSLKKLETPLKIIDGKKLNENLANEVKKIIEKPIFESWNSVNQLRSFDSLYNIIENPEHDRKKDQISNLDNFFGLRKKVWADSYTTLSLSFQRNPFIENRFKKGDSKPLTWEDYEFLLDYIHSGSSAFVLVPDIKISELFSFNDYLDYVDKTVDILSDFNNKPIFAPVPIKLDSSEFEMLIKHYKMMGYTNLWVDFNASQISSTQFTRLRYLLRNIKKHLQLNRTTLYFSHVKKEINKHVIDSKTVASNALAPFFGSDFLGISREPQIGFNMDKEAEMNYIAKNKFETQEEYEKAKILNKSRIFDPNTYYYYNIDIYPNNLPIPSNHSKLVSDTINRMMNSVIIHEEMNNARNYIEENKNVKSYAETKAALTDDPTILSNMVQASKNQTKLLEFFNQYKKK